MVLTDTSPEGGGILPAGHWSSARRVVRVGGLTTSHGSAVRPAFSNSWTSGGWPLEDSCVVFERGRETSSPVA